MWKRIIGLGAAFTAIFSPAHAQQTQQQSMPVHAAPAAWVQYAGLVEQSFEARLGGDGVAAQRLRTYWGSSGQSGSVPVQVWVDGQGVVSRVAFAPYLDDQANQDLTHLLQDVKLQSPPPSGILLPIRLNLHVAAPTGPAVGQGTDTAAGASSTDKH